jgi:predicted solute-binding protein
MFFKSFTFASSASEKKKKKKKKKEKMEKKKKKKKKRKKSLTATIRYTTSLNCHSTASTAKKELTCQRSQKSNANQ